MFQISSELFGDNHKKILDKFFEETVAPFAIANQPSEILNEVGGDDKDVPKALNVLQAFKKDLKEFIIHTPISEVLTACNPFYESVPRLRSSLLKYEKI